MAMAVGERWMCPDHEGHVIYNAKQYKQQQDEHDTDEGVYEPEAIRMDFNEKSLPSFCRPDNSSDSESEEQKPANNRSNNNTAASSSSSRRGNADNFRAPQPVSAATSSERERRQREREKAPKANQQTRYVSDDVRQSLAWIERVNNDMNTLLSRQYDQLLDYAKEKSEPQQEAKYKQYLDANEQFWSRHLNEPVANPPTSKHPLAEKDPSPLRDFVLGYLSGNVGTKNPYYDWIEPTAERDKTTEVNFGALSGGAPVRAMMEYLNANPHLKDFLALQRLSQLAHQVNTELGYYQLPVHSQDALRARSGGAFVKNARAFKASGNNGTKNPLPKQLTNNASPASNKMLPLEPVKIAALMPDSQSSVKRSAPAGGDSPTERPPKRQKLDEGSSLASPVTNGSPSLLVSTGRSSRYAARQREPHELAPPPAAPTTRPGPDRLDIPLAQLPPGIKPMVQSGPFPPPAPATPLIISDEPAGASNNDEMEIMAVIPAKTQPLPAKTVFVWPVAPPKPLNPQDRRCVLKLRQHEWDTEQDSRAKQSTVPRTVTHPETGEKRFVHYDDAGKLIVAVLTWKDDKNVLYSLALVDSGVSSPTIRFGRANPDADLDITRYTEARTASHEHSELRYDRHDHKLTYVNFGRNGTRINGVLYGKYGNDTPKNKQTAYVELEDMDSFTISHVTFQLHALQRRQPLPSKEAEMAVWQNRKSARLGDK
jgi:hypothetical protein